MIAKKAIFLLSWLVLCAHTVLGQAPIDMEEVYARDEFRYGVQAFHRGLFNKAILSFEKSLSFKPDTVLTRQWLGLAYYRSGFEDSALDMWRSLIRGNEGTALLRSKIETLEARHSLTREFENPDMYITAAEITNRAGPEDILFKRPSSVIPLPDGGFYMTAYGSNEIILFDINAALRQRFRGGLEGFDHPFDIIRGPDNSFLVSEFEGNRILQITRDGGVIKTFGKKGRTGGGMLGPQYLALDDRGYLYVTDWGNRQVVKFDLDGDFTLSFGNRGGGFDGFKGPTGIVCLEGEVYVLDNVKKNISVFDESGNFLRTMGDGLFHAPEGMRLLDDNALLIADTDRVVKFHRDTENVTLVTDFSGKAKRVTSAAADANGNIIAVDFNSESISVLSEITSQYSGMDVQIDSVNAADFPEVQVTATVMSKYGEPVVGLKQNNFILTERRSPTAEFTLTAAVNTRPNTDVTVLMEGSKAMGEYKSELTQCLGDIYDLMAGKGSLRVVNSGNIPAVEAKGGAGRAEVLRTASFKPLEGQWKFDLGLRLSVTELLPFISKKAVVFVTTGKVPSQAFGQYTLPELLAFMKNNHVEFHCVYLTMDSPNEILDYLCRETGGQSHYVYQPQGLTGLVQDIFSAKSGTYVFRYRSAANSDFGRSYIPLELETLLFKKSGRDESGFYAGLDLTP